MSISFITNPEELTEETIRHAYFYAHYQVQFSSNTICPHAICPGMSQDNQQNTGFLGPQTTNLRQAGHFYANLAPSTFSGFQQPNVQSYSTTATNYQSPGLQPQPTTTTYPGYQQPVWQTQTV